VDLGATRTTRGTGTTQPSRRKTPTTWTQTPPLDPPPSTKMTSSTLSLLHQATRVALILVMRPIGVRGVGGTSKPMQERSLLKTNSLKRKLRSPPWARTVHLRLTWPPQPQTNPSSETRLSMDTTSHRRRCTALCTWVVRCFINRQCRSGQPSLITAGTNAPSATG